MRLCWLTDIHLNFLKADAQEEFAHEVADASPDLVLIAGDIAEAPTLAAALDLIQGAIGGDVAYVLGNHDFYRGSVNQVRAAQSMTAGHYLHGAPPLQVDARTCVVGTDGWGDGRYGRPRDSDLIFTDWVLIEEFAAVKAAQDVDARLRLLREQGRVSAEALRESLEVAVAKYEHIIVVTHVPPFAESAGDNGSAMAQLWIPWLGCAATGEVIAEFADRHPNVEFEVLCGHTHVARRVRPRANIVVHTGAATYRSPEIQRTWEV